MLKILFASLFLVSCGTIIKNTEDVVSIDSSKRGAPVFNEKNEKIGTTPFFYKIDKKRKQSFTLLDNDTKLKIDYKCSWDFSESIFPDLVTTAIIFPVGGISLVVDQVNGNIYSCKEPINFTNSTQVERKIPLKIMQIPPSTKSFPLARSIEENFKGANILHNDAELAEIGITPFTDNSQAKLNPKVLNPILEKHSITHLMLFEISENENEITARPYVVDAFKLTKVDLSLHEVTVKKDQVKDYDKLLDKFHILPNSAKMVTKKFSNEKVGFTNSRHPKSLPKIFTSFSLGNVYNPAMYEAWDYDFYTTTNFSLPSWKTTTGGRDYLFSGAVGVLSGGVLLKTPIGGFSAEIGAGEMYLWEKAHEIESKTHFTMEVGVNYVFYFSKRFFFNAQFLTIAPNRLKLNGYEISLMETSVGIGYHFPELENWFREKI